MSVLRLRVPVMDGIDVKKNLYNLSVQLYDIDWSYLSEKNSLTICQFKSIELVGATDHSITEKHSYK